MMIKIVFSAFSFLAIPAFLLAQIPGGFMGEYRLDNNTATDQSGNNYHGTLAATSNDANRFGSANKSVAFNAGSSSGSLPPAMATAVQNDFSLGFWFKTSMIAPSSGAWYGGSALIDAEVCGVTSDWGVALIDGGAVSAGIGNPDITIKTPLSNYNNGSWHFVTVTRNAAAGTIRLYMAGVQVAVSATTTTAALNAPTSIRMGSNPCVPGGVYTGSLDDIIVYNRVLTAAEVTGLYNSMNAFALPLQWISFSGKWQDNKAVLQWEVEDVVNNDRFEIEHSTDGVNFNRKGIVENNGGLTGTGRSLYTFSDNNPAKGTHYYRIRQVDTDGRFSYSKTITLVAGNESVKKLYMRSNPVAAELVLMNDDQAQVYQLEIADVSGRILMNKLVQTADAVIRSDVRQLKPGYYTIKVYASNGVMVLPWIKQ